jgi:hypothetical protein
MRAMGSAPTRDRPSRLLRLAYPAHRTRLPGPSLIGPDGIIGDRLDDNRATRCQAGNLSNGPSNG